MMLSRLIVFALQWGFIVVRHRWVKVDRGELIDQLVLSIICDIYVISFSEGSIYRRGARRWRKLYRVNGHIFQAKRFNRVSIMPCIYHCTIFTLFILLFLPPPFTSFIHNLCESRSVAGATRPAKTGILCAELSRRALPTRARILKLELDF